MITLLVPIHVKFRIGVYLEEITAGKYGEKLLAIGFPHYIDIVQCKTLKQRFFSCYYTYILFPGFACTGKNVDKFFSDVIFTLSDQVLHIDWETNSAGSSDFASSCFEE